MKKFFKISLFTLLSIFAIGCKNKKNNQGLVSVNIAIQPSAAFIPMYIVRYEGLLEKSFKDKNINVVWQDFQSGPPINQSLSAQMSDIGLIGDVPTVSVLSGSIPMKIVGVPASGADAYAMLARADDKTFNSSADMKGKKIATVFGSTGHNFTTKLLEKNNLSFSDIEFISISADEAEDALRSNFCDAIVIWEPNVTRLIDKGFAKIVASGSETDLRGTNAFVVRAEYLIKHREVIEEVLKQYANAVKMIDTLDESTLQKLSVALKITPDQIKSISKKYNFSVSVSEADKNSLQDTVRFLVEIENLPAVYNVSSKIDNVFN